MESLLPAFRSSADEFGCGEGRVLLIRAAEYLRCPRILIASNLNPVACSQHREQSFHIAVAESNAARPRRLAGGPAPVRPQHPKPFFVAAHRARRSLAWF